VHLRGPGDGKGQKHYYRAGATFLLEYDNTQGNGNHIIVCGGI